METKPRGSGSFRRRLASELEGWKTEGLVTPDQAAKLTERYGLDALAQESRGTLLLAIYVIGALLVAGGVISFVAAHWDQMPTAPKVVLLFAAMLGCHGAGWWLWHVRGSYPKLGHGLVFLGTLIFGANIGLMAQIFHIESRFYNGFSAWALGALLVAYAAASLPNLLIAVVTSFIWFCGWTDDHRDTFSFYPFLAAAAFLPFAYWRKSVPAFVLAALAVCVGFIVAAGVQGDVGPCMLAMIGSGALLVGFGLMALDSDRHRPFAPAAIALGALALMVATYVFSFREVGAECFRTYRWRPENGNWPFLLTLLAMGVMSVWSRAILVVVNKLPTQPVAVATGLTVVLALLGAALRIAPLFVFLLNIAAFSVAVALIWTAVEQRWRGVFWTGLLFALLLIITRFFEYDTGLMLKSAVFLLCGLGVIYGGVQFENHLRARRQSHE